MSWGAPLTLYHGIRGIIVERCKGTTNMPMTVGELAKRAHVNDQTVRYYERRGLIAEPARTRAGYRQYPDDAPERIRFIKRAQNLGFWLKEI